MGPRAAMGDMEKQKFLPLPGLELRPLSSTARSQSLYRLRYPGSSDLISLISFFQNKESGLKGTVIHNQISLYIKTVAVLQTTELT
jgi:hypothetical protein